jgi:hypothetical protein
VVGYQDLDQYGDWQDTSDYGAVWYPTQVAADWAPYRDGHWAYIAPWGWTWVDDSPWGFAPYHYGRWAYTHRGWGWIPGPREVRPIYAPALVAFVGGGGWSVGIGGGPVGWFPLGPGEIYNPWYHASRRYYSNVNITNIHEHNSYSRTTIINNINNSYNDYRNGRPVRGGHYANRDAPRGFTAVPGNTFAGGRHVQRNLVRVDPRRLASAPLVSRDANKLRPLAGSAPPSRNPHLRDLAAGGFHREVVARHAPPTLAQETRSPARGSRPPGPAREGMGAEVRVLDSGERAGHGPRSIASERAGNDRAIGNDRFRAAGTPQPLPPVNRISALAPTETRHDNRADVRANDRNDARNDAALPSAHFAPSRGRNDNPRGSMPRPGVSYIATGNDAPPRPAYRNTPALPQVPQIRRADPADRPLPADDERKPHFATSPAMRRDIPMAPREPMRNTPPEPRFQRNEPSPRSYVREAPRPMSAPVRSEPPRPSFQPPRYQPPQPRAEAPRPERSQPRPAQKSPPRERDDDQRQH